MRRFSLLVFLLLAVLPALGATFTVNDLGDAPDETLNGVCDTAGAGTICTLRAAIQEANAAAGPHTIDFSVAGVITLGSALPAIVQSVDIDGATAPGYAGAPVLDIDGQSTIAVGLDFTLGTSNVNGLQIYGFTTAGIRIQAGEVHVTSSYLGPVTAAGTPNGVGVEIAGGTLSGISGNVISGNLSAGIHVSGGSGHTIDGNHIGTNVSGLSGLGNGTGVLVTGGTNVRIGSDTTAEWNVISGNSMHGVDVQSGSGIVVAGNLVGVDATGTAALGNLGVGIRVAAADNTVGTTAARNIVSGNGGVGILVPATSRVVVRNNYVGVDVTGTAGIGNFEEGIRVVSSDDIDVGGTAAGEGNVASFNGSDGISIAEVIDVRVHGNIAGLNATGTSTLGNGGAGIAISAGTNVLVGSLTGSGGNVVSGNSFGGIVSGFGVDNIFEGNRVGTNAAGTADEGNLGTGILIGAFSTGDIIRSNLVSGNDSHGIEVTFSATGTAIHSNIIGRSANLSTAIPNAGDGVNVCDGAADVVVGSVALGGNTIASNGGNGIGVEPSAQLNNTWAANSIYANTGLGIDLHLDGVTANDVDDIDAGANNLQNFPVITAAVTSATASQVMGTIDTTPNTLITVHVYSGPPAAADPSGFGEGPVYLGETTFTTDGSGNANWVVIGPATAVNDFATATATAPDGTSEFSANLLVSPAPTVQFSQPVYMVTENGVTATITVTRTGDLSVTSTVQFATSDNTAFAGTDYGAASGPLTFVPGDDTETFTVGITDDTLDEATESVTLTLSNPNMATLGAQSTASLEITDDDPPPAITISDLSLAEGNSGTTSFIFTISLSALSGQQVDVTYTTTNGTATSGSDYTTTAGVATIPAGTGSVQVTVPVLGDNVVEPDETFTVDLTNPVNATISDAQGLGTIQNDDTTTILITDVSLAEGNAGTTNFVFTVTLSAPSATPVSVDYATADGTATAPSDYTAIPTSTLNFPALSTSQQITVGVAGDGLVEPNETFFVNLSNPSGATLGDTQGQGTITNDDGVPTILISDVSQAEGDGGSTNFVFNVTLSGPSATPVTVDYATTDGTATAPSDYNAIPTTTLTFPALSTSQQITVVVAGDALVEANETFFVVLSNPSGAAFGDNQGQGTITNDDLAADLSVVKAASSPTYTSGQQITFTITVTNAGPGPASAVTVTDILPAGTTFVSSSAGCTGTTTVSCNLGTLASGANASVSIVVTATGTSAITNTASVASAATDPASGNDTGSVTITAAATVDEDIPTLSTWMLLALGAMLALFAARRV